MKLLLIQGATLDSLGERNDNSHGNITVEQLDAMLLQHANNQGYGLEIFYTNIEDEAIDKVHRSVEQGLDGILSNPGGFTCNAYALRNCLNDVVQPYVELHMTNIDQRNIPSVLSSAAVGVVHGFGINSYFIALEAILRHLKHEKYQDH